MKNTLRKYLRLIRGIACCACLMTLSVVSAQPTDRIALVIGNSDYGKFPLLNPVNDASAVGQLFREMDYDYVRVEKNATRQSLEIALDEFSGRAAEAEIAVIYYAGHGIQVKGENYLIPTDVTLRNRRDMVRLLPVQEMLDEVGQASSLGLIILDACRDNPFVGNFGEILGRSTAIPRGLNQAGKLGGNTLIAYATEANSIADDGRGTHSPYTSALIRHISTPFLEVRRMFGKIRDDVLKDTLSTQRPFVYGSLGGDEIFLSKSSGSVRISRSDVDSLGTRFIDLKNAIVNEDLFKIGTLTGESADGYSHVRQIFSNYDSFKVTLADINVLQSKDVISSAIIFDQLKRSDGSIETSKSIVREIPIRIKRSGKVWSRIQW